MVADAMSMDTKKPKIVRLPQPGEVIDGRYRLAETFASGGMGVIMRAEQLRTGRDVAVKLLHPHIASRPDFAARFMREVKVATLFDHPHIVRVYDVGETKAGGLYLVMELLEGEELKDIINREAPLTTGRVMDLGMQILDGLGEAHSREVVHRDLKPANVFVTTDRRDNETVKLLDFGIAKLVNSGDMQVTATGSFTGTPSYMAPEAMFEVEGINKKAADVYATGLVFLEMLTGRRVFEGKVLAQTLLQHLKRPVLIPQVIAETPLGEVLRRATAKHPDDRYADGDEMFNAMEKACRATPRDIRLSPGQIPGPAPETSPSLLDRLGQQEPEQSLAMLREIPQSEVVASVARRSSRAGLSMPVDTPTDSPSTAEALSPSRSEQANVESTMEISAEHIVTIRDEGSADSVEDFEVGPTQVSKPDGIAAFVAPGRKSTDPGGSQIQVDDDFDNEPTRVERPQAGQVDDRDFGFESTRVELPSKNPDDIEAHDVVDSEVFELDVVHDDPVEPDSDADTPAVPEKSSTSEFVGEDLEDPTLRTTIDADFGQEQPNEPAQIDEPSSPVQSRVGEGTQLFGISSKNVIIIGTALSVIFLGSLSFAALLIFGGDDDDEVVEDVDSAVTEVEEDERREEEASVRHKEAEEEVEEKEDDTDIDEEEEMVMVFVDIESDPSGATVFADDEEVGTTPLNLQYSVEDRPETLRFEKEGYEEESVEWSEEETELSVVLEEIVEEAPSPAPAPPPSPVVTEEEESAPDIDSVINEHLFR